mmetsp:Transcript_23350/g.53833  ORF Transcript_23350/g.53833 Transcript_23350/m.53833 type:complete len:290 (+) Transcript_23350:488-1357(+)
MVVGATRYKVEASFDKSLAHLLRVLKNLRLVFFEFRGLCHLQGHSQGRDSVVVGASLETWKNGRVHLLLKVIHDGFATLVHGSLPLPEEDHGTAGSPQCLVCCCGHNVSVFERRWNDACGHKARNVCHVCKQVCPTRLCNLVHAGIVNEASICTCASNDDLRAQSYCKLLALVIVNVASVHIQAVGDAFEVLCNMGHLFRVRLKTMRKVTTMREIQRQNSVMRIQDSTVGGKVSRRTAHDLDIHTPIIRVERVRLQRTLLAKSLCLINELVSSIVTGTWIPFGVLVAHA